MPTHARPPARQTSSPSHADTPGERKIDQIESRLGNIETLLKALASPAAPSSALVVDHARSGSVSLSGNTFVNTPGTGSSSAPTGASTSAADYESSEEESAFGGDSGLTAHTAFASEFLERAVKRTSLREVNPKMEAALANLSQLVEMQKRRSISHGPRFPLQKPVPPAASPSCRCRPWPPS
ncbi:hypothetical protein ACCO45_009766 [Purpureocillium lilacinum]|uniref:Uncharacterized protein n=1 Tax=Purpureocillium lilacinum TaxID=33203 RepID=A0ACC4DKP7_PURLI